MSGDQLEEYRKKMQEKHKSKEKKGDKNNRTDEQIAKELQEAEYQRANLRDEEFKGNRDNEYQPLLASSAVPVYPPPPSYQSYNQSYPPPPVYYGNNSASAPYRGSQSLLQRQDEPFLPTVKDQCCYINTQVCVLGMAVIMIISIIGSAIFLAVAY